MSGTGDVGSAARQPSGGVGWSDPTVRTEDTTEPQPTIRSVAARPPLVRLWRWLRRLPGRTPLRVKLITAVLALVAVALAVISFAGISFLRGYLIRTVDQQLEGLEDNPAHYLHDYLITGQAQPGLGFAVDWLAPDGRLVQVVEPVPGPSAIAPGQPLATSPGPAVASVLGELAANPGQPITVRATSGGGHWRVVAVQDQEQGGLVILGADLGGVYQTIKQLTSIDAIVSVVVIIVLAVIGVTVVRANLRPLDEIEETAEQIAAGHLDRRVPDRDPRTEVGSLGRSINAMLAQLEAGYRARQESEAAARQSEERMRRFIADASHELRTPLTAIRGFAEYYRQRGGVARVADDAAGGERTVAPGDTATTSTRRPAWVAAGHGIVDSAAAGDDAGNESPPDDRADTADAPARSGNRRRPADPPTGGGLTPDDLDRIMHRVEDEAARMGVLVEDLLLLARLDQQRPLDRQPVDLLTLAVDAVQDTRIIAPDRSVNLHVEPGGPFLVLGDEVRLRQVIGNLMSNALRHTPDGTPIDVRIRPGALDGHPFPAASGSAHRPGEDAGPAPAVVLEVADQGPGLTPEQAARVFERFYRADQARARKSGGSGLGLAIVQALVTAHGGTATVESTPGQGATFRVTLPLAPEALAGGPPEDDEADEPVSDGS